MQIPTAKFDIYIRTAEGREILAFTWTRDAASGIRRAHSEAPKFGHTVAEAWAVERKAAAA